MPHAALYPVRPGAVRILKASQGFSAHRLDSLRLPTAGHSEVSRGFGGSAPFRLSLFCFAFPLSLHNVSVTPRCAKNSLGGATPGEAQPLSARSPRRSWGGPNEALGIPLCFQGKRPDPPRFPSNLFALRRHGGEGTFCPSPHLCI